MIDDVTLAVILIAVIGITAQWVAWRFHIPAILLLILSGLAVGPGFGWLNPAAAFGSILHPLIGVFVAVILFEGGMSLHFYEFKEAGMAFNRLVTLGVLVTWVLGGILGHYVGNLSWPVAVLFGSIIVITGPTVIMPLLRQARLKRRPASYLKWEGTVNDPVGALLAVLVFEYLVYSGGNAAWTKMFISLGEALLAALALGIATGYSLGVACRRGYIPEFLKAPVFLAAALGVYGLADLVQNEAGLLAATVLGLVIGNMRLPSMGEIRRFKEYITILLVSGIFILLTAGLDPAVLTKLDWHSAVLIALLLFVVRPAAVLLATIGSQMDWHERALVAWVAPRGIVTAAMAGVFGPRMVVHGYGGADLLVPLVFAIILVTVTAHGTTIGWLARRLKLAVAEQNGLLMVGSSPWTVRLAEMLKEVGGSVMIADTSWSRLKPARLAGIPVYFGEILSEESEESLEFSEIGYVLAATSNDAYNALVCSHFAYERGYNRVFQLPLHTVDDDESRGLRQSLRGTIAFADEEIYGELERRYYLGWEFQKTRLSEEFTYEDQRQRRPAGTMEVLLRREDGEIEFKTAGADLEPAPGDVLVTFCPAPPAGAADTGARRPMPAPA